MITDAGGSNSWIRISVFYEKCFWRQLIADFLKPYLSEQRQCGNTGALLVFFNEDQGDNIRLAIECIAENRDQFADNLHIQLNDYLKLNPSDNSAGKYIGNEFFMDFSNNSIQYNLFDLRHTDAIRDVQVMISERMLNVFATEEFDNESIFSLALYIMMSFCSQWECLYGNVDSKISAMLYENNPEYLNTAFGPYYNLFKENSELIAGMYKEVIQSVKEDNSPMKLWPLKKCYNRVLSRFDKIRTFQYTVCMPFDEMIVNQLNMGTKSLPPIYYLIHLTLKSLSDNSQDDE